MTHVSANVETPWCGSPKPGRYPWRLTQVRADIDCTRCLAAVRGRNPSLIIALAAHGSPEALALVRDMAAVDRDGRMVLDDLRDQAARAADMARATAQSLAQVEAAITKAILFKIGEEIDAAQP